MSRFNGAIIQKHKPLAHYISSFCLIQSDPLGFFLPQEMDLVLISDDLLRGVK